LVLKLYVRENSVLKSNWLSPEKVNMT